MGVPLTVRGKTLGVISFITAESHRRYTAEDQSLAQDLARRAAVAIENANLLRALQESDRAKDVFLATLAHELRNPLAPYGTACPSSSAAAGQNAATRAEQAADMIGRHVGQLPRLVDDLLDVSRITTGKIELKKQPPTSASILHSAIETSRPHIEAARHKLSVQLRLAHRAGGRRRAAGPGVFQPAQQCRQVHRPAGNIESDRAGRARAPGGEGARQRRRHCRRKC